MSEEIYEPELGQALFGQASQEYKVSEVLKAAILMISRELKRVMWNIHQKELDSPFENTGASWECDTFAVEAYSWDDKYEQPYNFKYKDIEVSWYKYFGRGMSVNRNVTPDEVSTMLNDCLDALLEYERSHSKIYKHEASDE